MRKLRSEYIIGNSPMENLKRLIKNYKDIPLSDKDILKLVGGQANIIRYPDVYKYSSVDHLLYPYDACVLLYEGDYDGIGHWICLTKHRNLIEYFDPYGEYIDFPLRQINSEIYKIDSHQDKPYLSFLMLDCPYDLSYNEFQFQKLSKFVKDCGRWCSLRILLKDISLEQFKELFYGPNSDDIATLLTARASQFK